MKQLGRLNLYEHLRDPKGNSVGTVGRAIRACYRISERIQNVGLPIGERYHISPCDDETYETLRSRAMVIHQERMAYLRIILSSFIEDGRVYIEDGGIKSEASLNRKMQYVPGIMTQNRCLDLSRGRIIAKDLQTVYEVMDCLKKSFQESQGIFIRQMLNRYKIPTEGKTIYPATFLYLSDRSEFSKKINLENGSGGSLDDISTEIQIMTHRVRNVSESNRLGYSLSRGIGKYRDNTIYNKAMLRAMLLDWKEYFAQQKEKR